MDCPFNLKSTASVLQKCPRRITESPPRDCEHCYLSVEAEGREAPGDVRGSPCVRCEHSPSVVVVVSQEAPLNTRDPSPAEKKCVVTQMGQMEV